MEQSERRELSQVLVPPDYDELAEVGSAGSSPPVAAPTLGLAEVGQRARQVGLRRVQMLAWRDLDDPEAGGSELHADHIAARWAEVGIDVTLRTSCAAGHAVRAERRGYHVVRKAGRYMVFPRSAVSGLMRRDGARDGLVEIWNGMPFLSPIWARCPHIVFLHHVHAEMWQMALPRSLAQVGDLVERRIAPVLYRRSRVVTLSPSSRRRHPRGEPIVYSRTGTDGSAALSKRARSDR